MGKGSLGANRGQGRKTDPGTRFRNPGTDGTASEFPAKGAGNPWQSRQSPEGTMRARPVFHELSRAEGPSQQTGLPANFRQGAPEIHGSRVMRKHLIRGDENRGREGRSTSRRQTGYSPPIPNAGIGGSPRFAAYHRGRLSRSEEHTSEL